MDNASKALIIAGAILLAILLITIGIILINSGRDIAEQGETAMKSQNIQLFNNQFIPYEGKGKTYKEVVELLNIVRNSNITNYNEVIVALGSDLSYGYTISGYNLGTKKCTYRKPYINGQYLLQKTTGSESIESIIQFFDATHKELFDVVLCYCDKKTKAAKNSYAPNKDLNIEIRICYGN